MNNQPRSYQKISYFTGLIPCKLNKCSNTLWAPGRVYRQVRRSLSDSLLIRAVLSLSKVVNERTYTADDVSSPLGVTVNKIWFRFFGYQAFWRGITATSEHFDQLCFTGAVGLLCLAAVAEAATGEPIAENRIILPLDSQHKCQTYQQHLKRWIQPITICGKKAAYVVAPQPYKPSSSDSLN